MYFPYSFWTSNLKKQLLAFWTFNNCSDIGKDNFNGFNLITHGNITCVNGKIGNAISSPDDDNAFVDVSDGNKYFNLTTDKTFTFWFKTTTAIGLGGYLFGKNFNSPDSNYVVRYGSTGYLIF